MASCFFVTNVNRETFSSGNRRIKANEKKGLTTNSTIIYLIDYLRFFSSFLCTTRSTYKRRSVNNQWAVTLDLHNLDCHTWYQKLLISFLDEGSFFYQFLLASKYQPRTSDDKISNNTFLFDNYLHHRQLCLYIRRSIKCMPINRRASWMFDAGSQKKPARVLDFYALRVCHGN